MIARLARAELRHHRAGSRFLWVAILLASAVLTFFSLSFVVFLTETTAEYLPERDFFHIIQACLLAIAGIAVGVALYMLFGAFSMHYDRQSAMLGVLDSLGASRAQMCRLLLAEARMLSAWSLPLGLLLGTIFSLLPLPGIKAGAGRELFLLPILYLFVRAAVAAAALLPLMRRSGAAAIVQLRQNDNPIFMRRKSYRRSNTFRALSVPAQLGRKNVDHYARRYRAIAVTFACAASVLLIGIILYHYLGAVSVVLDENPYDGVDTTAASTSAVLGVLSLTAVLSLLLSTMAAFHAANVIFGIMRDRRREFAVLQSIGMDRRQIDEMVIGECGMIGMMTVGWCFFFSLLISAAFSVIFRAAAIYYPFLPVLIGCGVILIAVRLLGISACRYLERINVIESIK